jgi:hypothetical protein
MSQKQRAMAKLIEGLPTPFFGIAKHDEPLALATHAMVQLAEDGDHRSALKLARTITVRLELLAAKQPE